MDEAHDLRASLAVLEDELVAGRRSQSVERRRHPESQPIDDGYDDRAPSRRIKVVGGKIDLATSAAEASVIEANRPVYARGDHLVRPVTREVEASKGRTTIAAALGRLNVHALVDILCGCARFERWDKRSKEWLRVDPPAQVAQILLSRQGQWQLPQVAGIITTPTLRPDGSLLRQPGYDPATRLYHVADPGIRLTPTVERANQEDAARALADFRDLLAEFPFTSDVSRSVALSAMITPVVRGALSVAPLHAFRANTPGTGKSYLADLGSAIATGRPCPIMTAASDDAETDKRITALLLAGFPIVSIDNVNGELGGDTLATAVERPFVRVRPLGGSETVEIENRSTIYATGNNLRVKADMVRRTLTSDLDAQMERPELRKFAHDPVEMVLTDRGKYVSGALTVVRAYMDAGRPQVVPPIASFGDWSALVRSALVWLGCGDPALSMEAAREDDPELGELREALEFWVSVFPAGESVTLKAVADAIEEKAPTVLGEPTDYRHPEFREAFLRIAGERGFLNTRRMSRWLMGREGRMVGKVRFKRGPNAHGGVARWGVERVA